MIEWIKNTFGKMAKKDATVNYVVAEFHATRKKPRKDVDPMISELEATLNSTGEYMQIDHLHQKN
jgi:hypothetical protein